MRCPKCGYNSFDHYLTCPKCRKDLAAVRRMLNLTVPPPGAVNFFRTAGQRLTFPEPILGADSLGASIAPPLTFGGPASIIPAGDLAEEDFLLPIPEPMPTLSVQNFSAFEAPADLVPIEALEPIEDLEPFEGLAPIEELGPVVEITPFEDQPPLTPPAPPAPPAEASPFGDVEMLDLSLEDFDPPQPISAPPAAPAQRPTPAAAPKTDDELTVLVEEVNLDDLDGKL